MAGMFDDLIPQNGGGMFDDLIPATPPPAITPEIAPIPDERELMLADALAAFDSGAPVNLPAPAERAPRELPFMPNLVGLVAERIPQLAGGALQAGGRIVDSSFTAPPGYDGVTPGDALTQLGDFLAGFDGPAEARSVGGVAQSLRDRDWMGAVAGLPAAIPEVIAESLPDMLAIKGALPAYMLARAEELDRERIAAGGAENTAGYIQSLSTAVASGLLDRYGLDQVLAGFKPGNNGILMGMLRGLAAEAPTEAGQETLEYLGTTAGTGQPISLAEAGERALGGLVLGGGAGTAMGGSVAAAGRARDAMQERAFDRELGSVLDILAEEQAREALSPENAQIDMTPPLLADAAGTRQPAVEISQQRQDEPLFTSAPFAGQQTPAPPATGLPPVLPSGQNPVAAAQGTGSRQRVTTARGTTVEVEPFVIDAADLITSDDERYDQNIQPRQRGDRKSSDAQIAEIAGRLDPERLGLSPEADRGAPIVGPDGMVESGNGRVMAIRRAYAQVPERAAAYREWIEQQGFSTEGMAQPVLVRRRATDMTPEQRRQFAIEANQSATAEMSATERSQSDADLMDDAVISQYRGGDLTTAANAPFVSSFLAKLPVSEQGALVDPDGKISQAGIRRIQGAILGRAFGGTPESIRTLGRVMESTDDNVRSVTGALTDVAPLFARLRNAVESGNVGQEYNIGPGIVGAIETVSMLRSEGRSIREYLEQQGLFGDVPPVVDQLIRSMYNPEMTRALGREKIAEILRYYAEEAANQRTDQGGLFGSAEPTAPEEIIRSGRERVQERERPQGQQGGLLTASGTAPSAPESRGEPEGGGAEGGVEPAGATDAEPDAEPDADIGADTGAEPDTEEGVDPPAPEASGKLADFDSFVRLNAAALPDPFQITRDDLVKMTVDQLGRISKSVGLRKTGKKADLIEGILQLKNTVRGIESANIMQANLPRVKFFAGQIDLLRKHGESNYKPGAQLITRQSNLQKWAEGKRSTREQYLRARYRAAAQRVMGKIIGDAGGITEAQYNEWAEITGDRPMVRQLASAYYDFHKLPLPPFLNVLNQRREAAQDAAPAAEPDQQRAAAEPAGEGVAYHYGDLSFGSDTVLGRMSGSRSTGHFGTGVYFVSSPREGFARDDRPVQAVDLSEYVLARPRTDADAGRLHDAMRAINRMVSNEPTDAEVRDAAFGIWISLPTRGTSAEQIEAVIREKVEETKPEWEAQYPRGRDYAETAATRVMRELGYDGVDVRHLPRYDNFDYGTVVFGESLAEPDVGTDEARSLRAKKRKERKRKAAPLSATRVRYGQADNFLVFEDAGYTREEALNMSRELQWKIARDQIIKKYGFKAVLLQRSDGEWEPDYDYEPGARSRVNLNADEAIDVLRDGYANMATMARILGINPLAIGGNGRLELALGRGGKDGALAYLDPSGLLNGGAARIFLARQNDAFGHEWGHFLDWLVATLDPGVLDQMKAGGYKARGITGAIRTADIETQTIGQAVSDAWVNVIKAMYYDQAALADAVRQVELALEDVVLRRQARSEKAGKDLPPTKRELELVATLEKLLKGKYKDRGELRSSYLVQALTYDGVPTESPDGADYFSRPTEMFARAFEAYLDWKVGGSDQLKMIAADRRVYRDSSVSTMANVYPNEVDRLAIFAAIDELMKAVADASILPSRNTKTNAPAADLSRPEVHDSVPADLKEIVKTTQMEIRKARGKAQARYEREKRRKLASRQGTPQSRFEERRRLARMALEDFAEGFALTIRGHLLILERRVPDNQGVRQLREWFATDPGSGRFQGQTFEERRRQLTRQMQSRVDRIASKHGLDKLTEADRRRVRDAVVIRADLDGDALKARLAKMPAWVRDASADITDFYDWALKQLKPLAPGLGTVKSGYMQRLMNEMKVAEDMQGFVRQATKAYELVFERDVLKIEDGMSLDEVDGTDAYQELRRIINDYLPERAAELKALRQKIGQQRAKIKAGDGGNTADLNDELAQLDEEFMQLLAEIREEVKPLWSADAAQDYRAKIMGEGVQTRSRFEVANHNPQSEKFMKSRYLTPEADALLGDYMQTDPIDLMHEYASKAAQQISFSEFFGGPSDMATSSGKAENKPMGWKLQEAMEQAAADLSPDEIDALEREVQLLTGAYKPNMTRAQLAWRSKLNATIAPMMLARMLWSQLAEPFGIAVRTGSPLEGGKAFLAVLNDVQAPLLGPIFKRLSGDNRPNSADWRNEMGQFFGVTMSNMAEELMSNRLNMLYSSQIDAQRMANFMRWSGVHLHTKSMRNAAVERSLVYILRMAERATGPESKKQAEALMALGEIGITEQVLAPIRDTLRAGLKRKAEGPRELSVSDLEAMPPEALGPLQTAVLRFVDQAIQDPQIVDKPRMATQPEFSFMYGLLAFTAAFQRNVLFRTAKMLANPKYRTSTKAAALASIGALWAAQSGFWLLREMLFHAWEDWDEWKERYSDEDGSWAWTNLLATTASRTGLFGYMDPLVNSVASLRYQRDMTQLFAGPYLTYAVGSFVEGPGRLIVDNSESTDTAERKSVEMMYRGFMMATMYAALSGTVPGGRVFVPAAQFLTGRGAEKAVGAAVFPDEKAGSRPSDRL